MILLKITLIILIVFTFDSVYSQHTIKGTVFDTEGITLIGANVLEKGTSTGTITDIDGSFSLEVSDKNTSIIVSYIGMQEQEISLNGLSEIQVTLSENANLMDEVVVVGYGTQKRSNISGAVSTVSAEEIASTPVLRIEQAIQGRTAGVQITQNSGSPGSALTVRVRGTGTITNSDPLYVVDGVIVEGMDFLNPNDIENISVLKDAASAAIYGARAANGVVLVTTKTGSKKQGGTISYDTYYGNQAISNKLDLLNAREYAVISNESYINSGSAPFVNLQDPSIFNEGTDWQEAIFQNAPILSHNLSMNGGGEGFNVGLSGGYFLQDGVVGLDKARFKRYTARAVMSYDVKPWMKIGANIGFTNFSRNTLPENNEFTSPIIQALNMDPLTPVTKPDGTYAYSDFVDTDIRNPVNAIENTYNRYLANRVVGSTYGEIKFSDKLKFRSTYSVDATFAVANGFNPLFDLGIGPNDAPTAEKNNVNSVSIGHNTWKNWQWENLGFYNDTFGEHKIGIVFGTSANYNRGEYSGGANTNLPSNDPDDAYISNTVDPIGSQSAYESADEYTFFSYISKVNYDFKDRYLLTASFRADGSSKFGANKRFGYFPSVSAGWVINREEFFNVSAISLLKLRASWGKNGNDRIGNYGFTSVVLNGQNYTFGPGQNITNGAIALTVANPDLQWETTIQSNLGVDVELWDGKLYLSSDVYIKDTKDMLYNAPIPGIVGASAPTRNIGEIRNSGIEFLAQHRGAINEVGYEIGGNVSFLKNEVVFLGGGDPTFSGNTFVQGAVSKTDIGHPIASFFGYETDGIFQTAEEVASAAFQNANTSPGDVRFKDLNNDNVINDEDKTYIGNPSPDMIYGFNGSVNYKGFDFSGFFQGVYGNEIFNASVRYDKIGGNRPASILERWTGPGTSNFEPKVSISDPNNNNRVSDRFIEDGSYLRLKNIQLGYSLPASLLNKVNVSKLRFYVSGQNLLTFTNYSGFDPEIGNRGSLEIGIDRGFYPSSRTVLAGLQLTL